MNYLFFFLFFVLSILFLGGLISPKFISRILKKEFTRKKIFLVFGGLSLVCFILIGTTSPKSDTPATKSQPTIAEKNIKPTSSPAPEKSTQDKLKEMADKIVNKGGTYEVEYDDKDKMVILTYSKDEFYSAETVVKTGYTYLIKFGKQSFSLPEVETVGVTIKTKFTDQYGNAKIEPGVSVNIAKAEFQKFNWDGLKYQSLYDTLKNSAELHYINPVLLKTIDTSKLYYNEAL